jgi:hypothetical protein
MNLCYLVGNIFQGLYALGILNPSGMFNNSYRYAHIQSTKLIKILNEIVSITGAYISL